MTVAEIDALLLARQRDLSAGSTQGSIASRTLGAEMMSAIAATPSSG
jgi:hypothetical protein